MFHTHRSLIDHRTQIEAYASALMLLKHFPLFLPSLLSFLHSPGVNAHLYSKVDFQFFRARWYEKCPISLLLQPRSLLVPPSKSWNFVFQRTRKTELFHHSLIIFELFQHYPSVPSFPSSSLIFPLLSDNLFTNRRSFVRSSIT